MLWINLSTFMFLVLLKTKRWIKYDLYKHEWGVKFPFNYVDCHSQIGMYQTE